MRPDRSKDGIGKRPTDGAAEASVGAEAPGATDGATVTAGWLAMAAVGAPVPLAVPAQAASTRVTAASATTRVVVMVMIGCVPQGRTGSVVDVTWAARSGAMMDAAAGQRNRTIQRRPDRRSG